MDTSVPERLGGPTSSAADRVYRYVKDGIISRRFATDGLLAEGELAALVGVSRTPVREALLRLQVEGLVRLLPKRGVMVVPVTPGEVADVLETRRLIEGHTARKVVLAGMTPALRQALSTHLDQMRLAMAHRDTSAYVRADRAFHAAIVTAAGNAILSGIYSSLRDRQLRMGVTNLLDGVVLRGDVARMRATLAEHGAIFDAFKRGSVRAVDVAVTTHLDRTTRTLGGTS